MDVIRFTLKKNVICGFIRVIPEFLNELMPTEPTE